MLKGPRPTAELGPLVADLLGRRPSALITDFDGTISRIAPSPAAAIMDSRCRSALHSLSDHLGLVAIVSGRPAAEVREMVGLDGVAYIGNHGLERWSDGGAQMIAAATGFRAAIGQAIVETRARLGRPDLSFEDKGIVVAIHYRQSTAPAKARSSILAVVREIAAATGLVVAEGKRVVELRPPVAADKGTAVAGLIAETGSVGVVYLGDDRTDVTALRELRRARRAGRCATLGLAVWSNELPDSVRRAADYAVDGVDGVANLLEWLARQLPGAYSN